MPTVPTMALTMPAMRRRRIMAVAPRRLPGAAKEHPLDGPQHVPGAKHHAPDGQQCHRQVGRLPVGRDPRPGPLERAGQDHELAHKPVQPRQADARKREQHEECGQPGGLRRDPAKAGDVSRVEPLVDHADQREQACRRKAVIDQLQGSALGGHRREGEESHHDVAHVADRRVGDQPLEVGLHECHQPAVDDPRHAEPEEPRGGEGGGLREHRHREAEEAVNAQLEEHAGEIDATAGGGLDVRQRQPGVEGHDRHLDGEAGQ